MQMGAVFLMSSGHCVSLFSEDTLALADGHKYDGRKGAGPLGRAAVWPCGASCDVHIITTSIRVSAT